MRVHRTSLEKPRVTPLDSPKAKIRESQGVLRKLCNTVGGPATLRESMSLSRAAPEGKRKVRMINVGVMSYGFRDPARVIGNLISEALDPTKQPGKVKTLADMTPEEKADIEARYGKKIDPEVSESPFKVTDYTILKEHENFYLLHRHDAVLDFNNHRL